MLQQLQHINYRRSVLKLDDVSPALKLMKGAIRRNFNCKCDLIIYHFPSDTKIPMPGVNDSKQVVTLFIKYVENAIIVLPTKTKPKKFVFVGTNGKR